MKIERDNHYVQSAKRRKINTSQADETSQHKIIIGIDYGTTYSGMQWCQISIKAAHS